MEALSGPKYNGKYLHNVVIPTFDIKQLQPTVFSSFEVYKLKSIS